MSEDESSDTSEQETGSEDDSGKAFVELRLEEVTVSLEGLGSLGSPVDSEDRGNKEDAGSNKKNYGKVERNRSNVDACKDDGGNGNSNSKEAEVSNEVDVRNSLLGVVEVGFFMMMFVNLDSFFNMDSVSSGDNLCPSLERNA